MRNGSYDIFIIIIQEQYSVILSEIIANFLSCMQTLTYRILPMIEDKDSSIVYDRK